MPKSPIRLSAGRSPIGDEMQALLLSPEPVPSL
ncbi:hypothetical protein [Mesorhizobium sp.]